MKYFVIGAFVPYQCYHGGRSFSQVGCHKTFELGFNLSGEGLWFPVSFFYHKVFSTVIVIVYDTFTATDYFF